MMSEFIFGKSNRFKKTIEQVDHYAKCPWPILITGETGVGKELIAKRVHSLSNVSIGPFVPVNCGALPSGLFESELFGFERGAFSGAIQNHRGLVRMANGGSLFLDEIGELELSTQVKLLRLLESNEVRSVGSTRFETVHIRIIAATNQPLQELVQKGKFRLDLLERISVLPVEVPPLRERKEDLTLMAGTILERLGSRFSSLSLDCLLDYNWPGNARQLKNLLIRAHVLGDSNIDEALLQKLLLEEKQRFESDSLADPLPHRVTLAEIERHVVLDRLKKVHGNRKKAAKELGIAKSTLHEKLRKWKEKEEDGQQAWPLFRNPEPFTAVSV